MKFHRRAYWILALFASFASAEADLISWDASGSLNSTFTSGNPPQLDVDLTLGTPFELTFAIQGAEVPFFTGQPFAVYNVQRAQMTVGSKVFDIGEFARFTVVDSSPSVQAYFFSSYIDEGRMVFDLSLSSFSSSMDGLDVPKSLADLSEFTGMRQMEFGGVSVDGEIFGISTVDRVDIRTIPSPAVPEPGTYGIGSICCIVAALLMRRRFRRSLNIE